MKARVVALAAGLLALALEAPAWALDPARDLAQYAHEAWTIDRGLPQDGTFAVVQTRDGYLEAAARPLAAE